MGIETAPNATPGPNPKRRIPSRWELKPTTFDFDTLETTSRILSRWELKLLVAVLSSGAVLRRIPSRWELKLFTNRPE